jgi:hypothetical protein
LSFLIIHTQGRRPATPQLHCVEFLKLIDGRLRIYLGTLLVDDLNVPLAILADAMHKCRTRITASLVVSVCLESLLRVKQTIFSEVHNNFFSLSLSLMLGDNFRL